MFVLVKNKSSQLLLICSRIDIVTCTECYVDVLLMNRCCLYSTYNLLVALTFAFGLSRRLYFIGM